MRVIGTAGHVDHGKSTLVQALTGTHPDRLKEEREREMTIDLGFAWLTLPDGEDVGIVDVPGHRDFIENMLAGVGGIDAALFVIAADEGVMPQTREHLAILNILKINGGIIALTKVDLVDDPEWLDLIEEDLGNTLTGTVLESSPILRVSGKTNQGIPELIQALSENLSDRPPKPDLDRPRLPVDRVFSISGFGTVVTGTLIDGQLQVGDEIRILPKGLRGRIRGLQTHKRSENIAVPGSRTAVNISGVNTEQIKRGDVITHTGDYQPTRRLDTHFELLPDASQPLKHNTEVKFYIGASEVVARLRLLGLEELRPGDDGWLQLELREPVVTVRGDRYILRRPSPAETLGGGEVVDPHPKGRYKRFSESTINRLETLALGSPTDIFLQATQALGVTPLKDIVARSHLDSTTAEQAVDELFKSGQLLSLENEIDRENPPSPTDNILVTSRNHWEFLVRGITHEVENFHQENPLKRGISREELKSRVKLSPRVFNDVMRRLVTENYLVENGPLVFRPDHSIKLTQEQQRKAAALLERFTGSPYAPPTSKDSIAAVGDDLFYALIDMGKLVPVSSDVVFRREDYDQMVSEVHSLLEARGTITAAEVRDHFDTSRRYALAFLEHLDAQGITVRDGDVRKLK
jgi:selenocysteine-specific elongation factor